MRLTINLDDDLYAMAKAHSVAEGVSISKAVNALLRSGVPLADELSVRESGTTYQVSCQTGLRVNRRRSSVSNEDVRQQVQDDESADDERGLPKQKPLASAPSRRKRR